MFDMTIRQVFVMREAQRTSYVTPCASVGVVVSGAMWYRACGVELIKPGPYLIFVAAGMQMSFEFNSDRENWAVMFDSDDVRTSIVPGMQEIRCEGNWIRLPAITPIDPERVPGWQGEFARMKDISASPDPRSRFRIMSGVFNMLRHIMDANADTIACTPAEKLKRLIDEDERLKKSLADLSCKCGYSPAHLRKLFMEHYGISPVAYRNRRRMERAMEYISSSELTVKEIAYRTGFRHVSHFSSMFRDMFGTPPTESIKRFRHLGDADIAAPGERGGTSISAPDDSCELPSLQNAPYDPCGPGNR